ALTDGQKFAADLGYAPLPEAVVKLEMAALAKIKVSKRHRVPDRDRRVRVRADCPRLRHRRDPGVPVVAVNSEVRNELLADRDLGPGSGGVRRAAFHLGHAVLLRARAVDRDTRRARHRDLYFRALPGGAAPAAGVP